MLQSLGTAILSLYGLFIAISAPILLALLFGRLTELVMVAIDAVTRPVVHLAYRNASDDVVETRCQQALGVGVALIVIAALGIGSLISAGF